MTADKRFIVLSNLHDGFDWLDNQVHLRTFKSRCSINVPLPVLFIHDGRAVMTCSDKGRVQIRDSGTTLVMEQLSRGECSLEDNV